MSDQFYDLKYNVPQMGNLTEAELADLKPRMQQAINSKGIQAQVLTIAIVGGVVVVTLVGAALASVGWVAALFAVGAVLAVAGVYWTLSSLFSYAQSAEVAQAANNIGSFTAAVQDLASKGILSPAEANNAIQKVGDFLSGLGTSAGSGVTTTITEVLKSPVFLILVGIYAYDKLTR